MIRMNVPKIVPLFVFTSLLHVILVFPPTLTAQIKIHHSLTVENGLVQSQLKCIYRDRDGYLWFGTLGGASRWDGLRFRNFQTQDGLAVPQVNAILQGRDGRMYLATNGGGVNVWDGARFDTLTDRNGLADNRVYALFENEDGLFFGTHKGVSILKDGHWTTWTTAQGLAHPRVNHIFQTRDGTLCFATLAGISLKTPDGWKTIRQGLRDPRVTRITQGADGTLYAATWGGGLHTWRDSVAVPVALSGDVDRMILLDAVVGRDGALRLASYGGGLIVDRPVKLERLNVTHGLGSDIVTCLFEDDDGAWYLGTDDGVSIYREGLFETWTHRTGLADASAWAIHETRDGHLWFGSDGKGLSEYDPTSGRFDVWDQRTGLKHTQIRSVLETGDGAVYVATFGGGLYIRRSGRWSVLDEKNGLPNNRVKCLLEMPDGRVLAGTYNGGVAVVQAGRVVDTLTDRKGLVHNFVNALWLGSDSTLYVGTWGGLTMIRQDRFTSITKEQGLPNPYVNAIYETPDRRIFVGTDDGLAILDRGVWTTLTVRDGLSNNTILGITADDRPRVYLATNKGVNILDASTGSLSIQTLLHSDGLASDECNQGATFRDREGFLWFGTTKGVTRYDPRKARVNSTPPRVHITRVRLFEQDVPLKSSPTFRHSENYLKFDFVGVHLAAPNKVVYRIRLSGVDPEWMTTAQGFVQYTNLDPGTYTFEVKAGNEWNYWSEPVQYAFVVSPPFWKTWWFMTLAAAALIGVAYWIYRARVNRLLAMERIRIRIASDLHDDIGSTLTRIAAASEAIKSGRDSARTAALAGRIGELSREVIHAMGDIVWSIDARNDTVGDLVARMQDFAGHTLGTAGVEYEFITEGLSADRRLAVNVRENVYLIFKEAVTNIIKHARATRATIRLENGRSHFMLRIEDNGRGFGSGRRSGNGLRNIDMRAKRIGATVTWDGAGGTSLCVAAPRL